MDNFNYTAKNKDAAQFYSVHTFEIFILLSKDEYIQCKSILYDFCDTYGLSCYKHTSYIDCYKIFKQEGFTLLRTWRFISAGGCQYGMNIIINARKLLGYKKYPNICIAPGKDTPKLMPTLYTKLNYIGLHFLDYNRFHLRRLDLCTNIRLETSAEFEEYLRLICKGKNIYDSALLLYYDKTQKRRIAPKCSFTLTGATFEISLYAKQIQMLASDKYYSVEELQSAENQLRIELRFTNQKNNELIHLYQSLDNLICHIPEIGHKYIAQYLNAIYGRGNFYRFDIATQQIEASGFHSTTKQEMRKFMKAVAKGSLSDAINKFGTDLSDSMLHHFNQLHISPITLPIRSNFTLLPHPLYYITSQNVNHCDQDTQPAIEN